jgi:hypothetical protein
LIVDADDYKSQMGNLHVLFDDGDGGGITGKPAFLFLFNAILS